MNATSDQFSWAYGFYYKISEKVQLALFHELAPEFRERATYEYEGVVRIADTDPSIYGNSENSYIYQVELTLLGKLPDKLHAGFAYKVNARWRYSVDMTYVFWSQVSEGSRNNMDLSGSLIHTVSKDLSLSASFLSTGRRYPQETNLLFDINDNLGAFYLLGGLNYRYHSFDLDLAFTTSSFSSGEWRKQEVGKIGVGYHF